ncbi:MAG: hypothetical protein R3C68_07170 [Myxococcota bacterium]
MTDRSRLGNHFVTLPWVNHGAAAAATKTPSNDSAPISPVTSIAFADERSAPNLPTRTALPPELARVGLPYVPAPTLPVKDRQSLEESSLLSLAVALDVLSSFVEQLSAEPTILQTLGDALLALGRLGGLDDDGIERLLNFASSPTGVRREALAQRLVKARHAFETTSDPLTHTNAPAFSPTPAGVARSVDDILRATKLLVREATLLVQAKERLRYWQG